MESTETFCLGRGLAGATTVASLAPGSDLSHLHHDFAFGASLGEVLQCFPCLLEGEHLAPARSLPKVAGSWKCNTGLNIPVGIMLSIGFRPAAWTCTSNSSAFGVGRGTSANPMSGDLP